MKAISDTGDNDLVWEAPGPGAWEFDASHQQRPYPAVMLDWAEDALSDGFRSGMALIGVPLDTLAVRAVHGWVYMHAVPLGGPDNGGAMPPKIILSVLFRVVPALRRRHATARKVFTERPWNSYVDRWTATGRQRSIDLQKELASVAVEHCRDDDLADHVTAVNHAAADAFRVHFTHAPLAAAAVGQFALRTEQLTNLTADRAFDMLAGYSNATTEPFRYLDRILATMRPDLDLRDDPDTVLRELGHDTSPSRAALADYLDRFGDTIVEGESPLDPTLRELPALIVSSLRARQHRPDSDARTTADERAATVRAEVPTEYREEWERLLDDARRVTSLRDDDAGAALRLVGRSRHVLVEAGKRLRQRSLIEHSESVFDITAGDIRELLTGQSTSTNADANRRARLHAGLATPPAVLGPAEDPPDFSRFPPAVARVSEAAFAYIGRLDNAPSDDGLSGVGIGTEPATGRARLVLDVADLSRIEPGDILVTPMTTPAYNAAIAASAGLVCDHGGTASHAAIMAREFAIPAVVGTGSATTAVPDGTVVTVDPLTGTIMPKR